MARIAHGILKRYTHNSKKGFEKVVTDHGATSLPYEKDAPNDYRWTSDAYDELLSGSMEASLTTLSDIRTVRVAGSCPRCHHELNVSQILDAVTGEGSGSLGTTRESGEGDAAGEGEYLSITAACQCSEPHAGRPEGIGFGCGINFLVEIAVE